MIEWVQLSAIILDNLFKYGPEIKNIFKSKDKKKRQKELKDLCDDFANKMQKNLLSDLKTLMNFSVNIPLNKNDIKEVNYAINKIIQIESDKLLIKMNDLVVNQFNDILVDNMLCTPKYHNLVIIGSDKIYKVINKIFEDDLIFKDNIKKYQLFSTKRPGFRAGLLLYALNISDILDIKESKTPSQNFISINGINGKDQIEMKKLSIDILTFIKNKNKKFSDDLSRKISGIMICIDKKKDYELIKDLINNLNLLNKKHKFELEIYLIIINKCINTNIEIKDNNYFDIDIDENITINNCLNIMNKDNNTIFKDNKNNNFIEKQNNNREIKSFNISIEDNNIDIFEIENKNEVETFLNELVVKYIDNYMKKNIDNIFCTLNLQFNEYIKLYFQKLEKEFNKAVSEMNNFNLRNIPLKVKFESQMQKIFIDIFLNHIYPISISITQNSYKIKKFQFSNESLNQINDLFYYNLNRVKDITEKAKGEYTMRLISKVKEGINELFNKCDIEEGNKEKEGEGPSFSKQYFIDNIIQSLNEKIEISSDIYDLCLCYLYISKDLFKILSEKISEFTEDNIFGNIGFKEGIKKRIIQQLDSYQRRVLNID